MINALSADHVTLLGGTNVVDEVFRFPDDSHRINLIITVKRLTSLRHTKQQAA